jgi:hypothetical protein
MTSRPFRLKIEGVLEAVDHEEALRLIAQHLTKLANGVLPPDLFLPGSTFQLDELPDTHMRSE